MPMPPILSISNIVAFIQANITMLKKVNRTIITILNF